MESWSLVTSTECVWCGSRQGTQLSTGLGVELVWGAGGQ